MLRFLVPGALALAASLSAQTAPNVELRVPDFQAIVAASKTTSMAQVVKEPEVAGFLESMMGTSSSADFFDAAIELMIPDATWAEIAAGAKSLHLQGFITEAPGSDVWFVARLEVADEAMATEWTAALTQMLASERDSWVRQEASTVILGLGDSAEAVAQAAPLSLATPAMLERTNGATTIVEARGRFGPLLEALVASTPEIPTMLSDWLSDYRDADGHFLMELTAGSAEAPSRVLTRMRRAARSTAASSELSSAFGVKELEPAALKGLPADAMFACSTSMDASRVIPMLFSGQMNQKELEAGLGFPLERLWSNLGPGVTMWSYPISGPAIPTTFMKLESRDAEAAHADLSKLLEFAAQNRSGIEVRTRDYKVKLASTGKRTPVPITTLRADGLDEALSDVGVSLSPAFCLFQGELLIASSGTQLKKELKRRGAGEARPTVDLTGPLAAMGVQGATTVWNFDFGKLVDGLLSLARVAGGMAGGMLPVDLSNVPSAEGFVKHVRPTFHAQGVDAKGAWMVHEASFGPETWMGIVGAGARMFGVMAAGFMSEIEAGAPAIVEGNSPAVATPKSVTEETFSDLLVGIAVYEIATGGKLSTLDQLVEKSEALPTGCLDTETLPTDGWGNAFHFEAKEDGGYKLWSAGPDGVNQNGAGDDLVGTP